MHRCCFDDHRTDWRDGRCFHDHRTDWRDRRCFHDHRTDWRDRGCFNDYRTDWRTRSFSHGSSRSLVYRCDRAHRICAERS